MICISKKLCFFFMLFFIHVITITTDGSYKHFVIVIPSYNNAQWYERNVESVLQQNYPSFDVIYTDDCSTDGTGELVEEYLRKYDHDQKILLIKNKERKGALYNLYRMIMSCDDNSIIVTLDGDDWFPDPEVLTRLNNVYQDENIWLTYGQFKLYPSGNIGWATPMPDYIIANNTFRNFQHLPTHLRTFYTWLFKKIKLEDLLYLGRFYPMTWDMVMMFPMIEMAGERHKFISDIMYVYNDNNAISDHNVSRQLQAHLAQVVKKKKRYERLDAKPVIQKNAEKADAFVFAQDANSLRKVLSSVYVHIEGIDRIFVIYYPVSPKEELLYNYIINEYPSVEFHRISAHRSNFKQTLCDVYKKSMNNYILFINGTKEFKKTISLSEMINLIDETAAYAFYFNLNAEEELNNDSSYFPLVECKDDTFVWNFALARDKWSCANSFDYVLHKKSESLAAVLKSNYDLTPRGLQAVWANEGNLDKIGLCFKENVLSFQ